MKRAGVYAVCLMLGLVVSANAADVTIIVGSDGDAPIKTFNHSGGDSKIMCGCYPGSAFPPDWISMLQLYGTIQAQAKGAGPYDDWAEMWDASKRCTLTYQFSSKQIKAQVFCEKNYTGKVRSHTWKISSGDTITVRQLAVPRFQFVSHPKGEAEIGSDGGYLTVSIKNNSGSGGFRVNVSSDKKFVTCTKSPEVFTVDADHGFLFSVEPNTTGKARSASVHFYDTRTNPLMSKYLTIRQSANPDGGSHVVTYKPGSFGTGSEQTDTKIAGKVLVLRDAIYTRSLATQDGWSKSDGGSLDYKLGASYSIEQSITLYPHWKTLFGDRTIITYNSDSNSSGNSESSGKKIVISKGTDDSVSLLGQLSSKSDSVQTGWTTADGSKTLKLGEIYSGSESLSLFPIWKTTSSTTTYTITYKPGSVGSGTVKTKTFSGSGTVSLLATTYTRDGYEQTGWTTRDGGSKEYELGGNYAKAADITLYPTWKVQERNKSFVVSYLPTSDALGSVASVRKMFGDSITLAGKSFERVGYRQTGWAVSDGGVKKYELGGTYSANANVTLYPTWTADKSELMRTISYSVGTGSGGSDITDTVIAGVSSNLRGATFSLDGMTQTGWSLSDGGEKAFELGESINVVTATKLYPTWEASSLVSTITYDPGEDGEGESCTVSVKQGQTVTLRGAIFTRGNYQQTGWSLSENGIKAYDLGASIIALGDMKLYPFWVDNSSHKLVSITFDPGTLGRGFLTTTAKTVGESVSLQGSLFTRDGFVQTGWSRTDGGAMDFTLGAAFSRDVSTTLYPTWAAVATDPVYVISYKPGEADFGTAVSVVKKPGETLKLMGAVFSRVGYVQTGWSISLGGVKVYELGADYSTDAPLTLYPVWTSKTVTSIALLSLSTGVNGTGMNLSLAVDTSSPITLPAFTYTRTGYKQDGWSLSDGGAKAFDLGATVDSLPAQTLYPHWQAIATQSYHIFYIGDTNTTSGSTLQEKAKGGTVALYGRCFFHKSMPLYIQTGWALSPYGPLAYNFGDIYSEDKNLTLYPYWERDPASITYMVTYNTGSYGYFISGSYHVSGDWEWDSRFGGPVEALRGAVFKSTRNGWFQTGWSRKNDGDKDFALYGPGPSEASVKLYPYWTYEPTRATYTISFDANGGSGNMTNVTFSCTETHQLPANEFVREGYRFLGWSLGPKWYWKYDDEDAIEQDLSAQDTVIKLYAQWIVEGECDYTYTFGENEETATICGAKPLPYGDFSITNRVVSGGVWYWQTKLTGIGANAFNGSTMTSVEIPSSVVSLEANAFSGCNSLSKVFLTSAEVAIDSLAFEGVYSLESVYPIELNGFDFIGWQTGDGTIYPPDSSVFLLGRDSSGKTFSIHPAYIKQGDRDIPEGSYEVLFAESGAVYASRQCFAKDKIYSLPRCTATPPSGKRFAGWACSNGKRYDDEMLVFDLAEAGETVRMTAIWE